MEKFIMSLRLEVDVNMDDIGSSFIELVKQEKVILSNASVDITKADDGEKIVEQMDITADIIKGIKEEA